jgi:tetratricopeptide (TPR) repeat protein
MSLSIFVRHLRRIFACVVAAIVAFLAPANAADLQEHTDPLAKPPPQKASAGNQDVGCLRLSYQDFDQQPGGGWRKIAEEKRFLDAAKLIAYYEKEKQNLAEWQHVNLRFHAGQLYAIAGRKDEAIACFKKALYRREPAASPIRWNAYVQATIAFLEGDRKTLLARREEIAKGPKFKGAVVNLDVVDGLIEHFGESYAAAYGKTKKKPR